MAPSAAAAGSTRTHLLSRIFSSTSPTAAKTPKPQPKINRTATPKTPTPAAADHKLEKPLKAIIKSLIRQRKPEKLVSEFVAASSASARFRDRHRVFEVAVSRLASYGRHDGVEAIIDAQKPFLQSSSEGFAARLIRLYGRATMPSHAVATFRELPEQHKSTMTFNAVLAAYAEAEEFDNLATVFQEIPASHSSVVPSVYSYNILIRALCKMPNLSEALDTIKLMEKNCISPDIVSFNTLLNGFYNYASMDEAEKVWEMMKERNLAPDVKCYNAKLRGLVAGGKIEDAVAVVEMMEKDRPKPDTVSYNELIRGYCKAGNLEEAKKLFDELIKNGYTPNKGTYETIVPRLLDAGELDLALKCCHDLVSSSSRCRVGSSLLQDVVTALVGESRVEEATKLVELGRKKYYPQKGLRMPHTEGGKEVPAEIDEEELISEEKECKMEESKK